MLAIGDSHIKMFAQVPLVTSIISVPGATAYGLANKNSLTSASKTFTESLGQETTIISCLGEVDCNVLYWRMSDRCGIRLTTFLSKAISHYFDFLDSLKRNVIVCTIPLPVIDNYSNGAYSLRNCKPRADIKANKKERTEVVNLFNAMLESNCAMCNMSLLNYIPDISNGKSLRMNYAKSPDDSHLDPVKVGPILTKHLEALISDL